MYHDEELRVVVEGLIRVMHEQSRELETLVDRAIARLEEGATQASLPAMSSYERKLVHDIVADKGFVSESYGEGADRHTVISRG